MARLKRSPLTPTAVAVALTPFCISVTFSRPTIASFEDGRRATYRPPGFGALTTFRTTGPRGVNCTCRW